MRRYAADEAITAARVPDLRGAKLLHVGSVSLRPGHSARDATLNALDKAQALKIPISVDVNLRARMFSDEQSLKQAARLALNPASFIKCTAQEARFIFGESTPALLFEALPRAKLLCITDDERPAQLATRNHTQEHSPEQTVVTDATGAGDAFFAVILDACLQHNFDVEALDLETLLASACAAGTQACTHVGALKRL